MGGPRGAYLHPPQPASSPQCLIQTSGRLLLFTFAHESRSKEEELRRAWNRPNWAGGCHPRTTHSGSTALYRRQVFCPPPANLGPNWSRTLGGIVMSEQEQTEWLPSGSLPAFQAQQFRTSSWNASNGCSRRGNYLINVQPALSNTRQQYAPFHLWHRTALNRTTLPKGVIDF